MLDIIAFLFGIIGIMTLLSVIIFIALYVPIFIKNCINDLRRENE